MFTHYDVESMSPICLILYPNNSLPKCLKQAGFGFSSPSTPTRASLTIITQHAECNHLRFSFTELRVNSIS